MSLWGKPLQKIAAENYKKIRCYSKVAVAVLEQRRCAMVNMVQKTGVNMTAILGDFRTLSGLKCTQHGKRYRADADPFPGWIRSPARPWVEVLQRGHNLSAFITVLACTVHTPAISEREQGDELSLTMSHT